MCVVSRSCGGGRDGGGGWYACGAKPGGVGGMSVDAGALPKCKMMTPDRTSVHRSW